MGANIWSQDGHYLYSDNLSEYLRFELQPRTKFRNLCDAKEDALGLHRGASYAWNVYSKIANRGGPIGEQQRMPESTFNVTQRTLTIGEFGNSVPYTGKVELLGEHDVKDIIDQTLRDDARKVFDRMCAYQFFSTPLKVVPGSGNSTSTIEVTTNGTPAQTNAVNMRADHIKPIVDVMKERNIPPFEGDDYMAISHPTTYRPFKNDLEDIHIYTDQGIGMVYAGEIGRYESMRFIEQNEIPKGHAADVKFNVTALSANNIYQATDDAWNGGFSSWALFFGADTVIEAPAVPEEIRAKIPQDFGRDHAIAYYYMGEAGLCHTDATNARILHWDSVA